MSEDSVRFRAWSDPNKVGERAFGTDIVGFCPKCGSLRQDTADGRHVTDCVCTAEKTHAKDCNYLLAVSCPIDVGGWCKEHGHSPCLECDCTCSPGPPATGSES